MDQIEYLGKHRSTIAMAPLQGPLVMCPVVDRYHPVEFICFYCKSPARELCLGVPIAIRKCVDGRTQIVVRDHVAIKCLKRYMMEQSEGAAGSSWECTSDLVAAMLSRVYGCSNDLATDLPLCTLAEQLPPFNMKCTDEERKRWDSIAWHSDHKLVMRPPDEQKIHFATARQTILIDRHVRKDSPTVPEHALTALLPDFVVATYAKRPVNLPTSLTSLPPTLTSTIPFVTSASSDTSASRTKLDDFLLSIPLVPPAPQPQPTPLLVPASVTTTTNVITTSANGSSTH